MIPLYSMTLWAIYRVAKKHFCFILFFSHGVADIGDMISYLMKNWIAVNIANMGVMFYCPLTQMVSHVHILLLAINRAFAVLSLMKYELIWTRRFCIFASLSVWGISIAWIGSQWVRWLATQNYDFNSFYFKFTPQAQPVVTLMLTTPMLVAVIPSIPIYLFVFATLMWKSKYAADMATTSTNTLEQKLIIYCLVSAFPICTQVLMGVLPLGYYQFIGPDMVFLVIQWVHWLNVILLIAMSKQIRSNLPIRIITNSNQPLTVVSTMQKSNRSTRPQNQF